MTKSRILIFSLAYYPWVGGAEVAIKELIDRLPQYDWELVTLNFNNNQKAEEMIGGVKVFRLPATFGAKYLFPWRAARWATRRQREFPYQLIWGMMANQAGMAAAKFKKLFPAVPFLLTLQEGDDLNSLAYRLRLLGPRFFGVFKSPDQIQVISSYLEKWARRMGAICPVTVIPNGVDFFKFEARSTKSLPADATPQALQAGETNSNDQNIKSEKIIITTSRLVRKNGVDDLIKSLTFLPENVKLQILGEGPEERALKALVERLKLVPRVSFLGYKPSSELLQYLARADVFCRPSRSEGLGNSFLEAMAAGLPVIGTPVGGITDFLYDGADLDTSCPKAFGHEVSKCQTGWFCQVNDPESIARQVRFILEPGNQVVVTAVTQRAAKMVGDNYDWDKLALRFAKIL